MYKKEIQEQHQPQVILYVAAPGQEVPLPQQSYAPPTERPSTKAQMKAVFTGAIIFLSAGMNMAKGLFWSTRYPGRSDFYISTWFIGVILGAILAAALVKRLEKRSMLATSCILILIEGLFYTNLADTEVALFAGRYLNGMAFGFAIIPFLLHTSENSTNTNRGLCATEQFSFTIGIVLQMNVTALWDNNDNDQTIAIDRFHGILDMFFSVFAVSMLNGIIESPVFHLRKGDDEKALKSVMLLDSYKLPNADTYTKLEMFKDYLRKQENMTSMECVRKFLWPLIKMIVFRSMMLAFSFSTALCHALIFSSYVNNAEYWSPPVAALGRLVGSFMALCLIKGFSRKLPPMLSSAPMGVIIVFIATHFASYDKMEISDEMAMVTLLCILTQFLAGLYAPYTSVHVAEAFPLKVKPYFIAICVVVEQLLQIIVINAYSYEDYTLVSILWAHGLLICAAFVLMCFTMPETKGTTLKEAQERFKQLFYCKLS